MRSWRMKAERIVVDSNVLIGAALNPQGRPREVMSAIRSANGVLLLSAETFFELRSRFLRSKFDAYVSRKARLLFLAQLEAVSEWLSIVSAKLGCRDRDDDKFLETSLVGEADFLITGDRDLLVMSPFREIPIVTSATFLSLRSK